MRRGSSRSSFQPFAAATAAQLRELLSERVTIANPFDFHTHIWFDRPRLHSLFSNVHARRLRCGRLHGRLSARGPGGPGELCRRHRGIPRRLSGRARARGGHQLPAGVPGARHAGAMSRLPESCPCKASARPWRRSITRRPSARPGPRRERRALPAAPARRRRIRRSTRPGRTLPGARGQGGPRRLRRADSARVQS